MPLVDGCPCVSVASPCTRKPATGGPIAGWRRLHSDGLKGGGLRTEGTQKSLQSSEVGTETAPFPFGATRMGGDDPQGGTAPGTAHHRFSSRPHRCSYVVPQARRSARGILLMARLRAPVREPLRRNRCTRLSEFAEGGRDQGLQRIGLSRMAPPLTPCLSASPESSHEPCSASRSGWAPGGTTS